VLEAKMKLTIDEEIPNRQTSETHPQVVEALLGSKRHWNGQ
jgi:hypothetical protein